MFKIKLQYSADLSQTVKETRTAALCLELYNHCGIECYQTSAARLEFAQSRDLTLAVLYLSKYQDFSAIIL